VHKPQKPAKTKNHRGRLWFQTCASNVRHRLVPFTADEIGRASCRERVS
jgi:hypothetical protein